MYLKKNKKNKIEKYPYTEDDLRNDNKNTSFPLNPFSSSSVCDEFLIELVEKTNKPDFDEKTHKCIEEQPIFLNGQWNQEWNIIKKTSQESKSNEDLKWAEIRIQRNIKLNDSDWKMTKALETGEDASNLRNYRQKLRDIPQTEPNPFSINWPVL